MTGWLTRHPTALSEEDRAALKDVLARCPELDTAARHIRDFGEMLTAASAPRSLPGSTPSRPANCPALPASRATCAATLTL
ncbi:hypothetical protein [Streptomyces flaveus]|uniref:hypothetical protein n=1 Tax=Streptomyces flaveus TaxID=66370 RepID=UPI00333331BE